MDSIFYTDRIYDKREQEENSWNEVLEQEKDDTVCLFKYYQWILWASCNLHLLYFSKYFHNYLINYTFMTNNYYGNNL